MKNITQFKGEFGFLSNFYPCVIRTRGGREWPSVEHLFQAGKTKNRERQEDIRYAPNPRIAKSEGRRVSLREDWEEIKYNLMESAVRMKFLQNETLKQKLISTHPAELIEGGYYHDNTWGDCYCSKCKNIPGENLLGKILMEVRELLIKGKQD